VLTVGVDMKVDMSCSTLVKAPIVLLVASGNPLNAKGLRDFLHFAWPRVRQAVPNAVLHVVGSVGRVVPGDEPGVTRMGQVDDLGPVYGAARVVINPPCGRRRSFPRHGHLSGHCERTGARAQGAHQPNKDAKGGGPTNTMSIGPGPAKPN